MNEKDNGGPAFPGPILPGIQETGMTLRDWFAGQAACGLLAHPACLPVGPGHEQATRCVVRESYAIADAMLEARK